MAPVASPTPIICVTMFGNMPHSRRGSMIVCSFMALRTFISASSSTALPEVLAVMLRPSRTGTPEVISVPNGEAADRNFAQQRADHGDEEQHLVEVVATARMLANLLDPEPQTDAADPEDPPEGRTNGLSPMVMRVGRGRATPKPANRLAKIGTTDLSSAPTIKPASADHGRPSVRALDLCCGTGDMTFALHRPHEGCVRWFDRR